MDQNLQSGSMNNIPNANPAPSMPSEKKVGPIIAVLIIVLVLIIAALYLFASRINEPALPSDSTFSADAQERQVQPITSDSTDLADLQADLDASADGLDSQNF